MNELAMLLFDTNDEKQAADCVQQVQTMLKKETLHLVSISQD